jgi:hypothetical protein
MRKRSLTEAVAVAIVVAIGLAPKAQAVHLDPNGVGQVLVFPYYTVNSGNQTLLSVVNKTNAGKAVKVRFREGRNSRQVLEFNLYLSAFDVWTATLFSLSDSGPNNPANLTTNDNSCTVPRIKGNTSLPSLANGSRYLPFNNLLYTGSNDEAGPDTLDRTREGHFEMIEMGEVVSGSYGSISAITHVGGVPTYCAQIVNAWQPNEAAVFNYWFVNPTSEIAAPRGGLFGNAALIDTLAGTLMSYDADAIAGFSDISQHTAPGSGEPTLGSVHGTGAGGTIAAQVFREGSMVTSRYPAAQAIDAISALFAQSTLLNEFVTSAATGASSEWIITFPTKYAYTDEALVGTEPIPPFARIFPRVSSSSNTGKAPVEFAMNFFDREEGPPASFCPDPTDPSCSPFSPPPQGQGSAPALSWATNVIAFNQTSAAATGSRILGSRLAISLDAFEANVYDGWAVANFFIFYAPIGSPLSRQQFRADVDNGRWEGVPALGFAATAYTNGQVTPGVLANYADLTKLRTSNRYQLSPLLDVLFKHGFEPFILLPPD